MEGAILIEAKTFGFFDELWVVTLPKDQAVKRILERDPHLSEQEAHDRLKRQIDDEERLKYASFSYSTESSSFEENEAKILRRLDQISY